MTDDISTASVTREDLGLTEGQALALAATVAVVGIAAAGAYVLVRNRARANRPLYEEPLRRLMGAAALLGGDPPPPAKSSVPPAVKSMLLTAVTALAKLGLQRWLQRAQDRARPAQRDQRARAAVS